MDNLAKDAFMAKKNGMSYGQYMAMFKPKADPKKKPILKEGVSRHTCQQCGKEFIQYDKRRRLYCSPYCKQNASYRLKKEKEKVEHGKTE